MATFMCGVDGTAWDLGPSQFDVCIHVCMYVRRSSLMFNLSIYFTDSQTGVQHPCIDEVYLI